MDERAKLAAFAAGEGSALLRDYDLPRYYACLFAPETTRSAFITLYALNAEMLRLRQIVPNALTAEIRIQWWRDQILEDVGLTGAQDEPRGEAPQNVSLSQAIQALCRLYALPTEPFLAFFDAHLFDFYEEEWADWSALEVYMSATQSFFFRYAAQIIDKDKAEAIPASLYIAAGMAYGLLQLVENFALDAKAGRCFLPQSLLSALGLTRADVITGQKPELTKLALEECCTRAAQAYTLFEGYSPHPSAPQAREMQLVFLPLTRVPSRLKQLRGIIWAGKAEVYQIMPPSAPLALLFRFLWRIVRG